jgi:hypothetical protein
MEGSVENINNKIFLTIDPGEEKNLMLKIFFQVLRE